jgi:hypothetical protein
LTVKRKRDFRAQVNSRIPRTPALRMALSDAERAKVQEIYEGSRWWEGSAKGKPRENNLSSNAIAETRESSEKGKKTRVNLSSNAIAGTIAGFTSSSLTHPLDVIKTRFQVSDLEIVSFGKMP